MSDLFWLSKAQMRRIEPYFPLSRGMPRVDDRRVVSGIIFVIKNGLRWRDAPTDYGPHKTIYNRFIRWSRLGASIPRWRVVIRTAALNPSRIFPSVNQTRCFARQGTVNWSRSAPRRGDLSRNTGSTAPRRFSAGETWEEIVSGRRAEIGTTIYFAAEDVNFLVAHAATENNEINIYLSRLPAQYRSLHLSAASPHSVEGDRSSSSNSS